MSRAHDTLVEGLRRVVGHKFVITDGAGTLPYRTGYRIGEGDVLAVARPAGLLELWRVAELCTKAGAIIIVQAANTGLTGGSTPCGSYDRQVVIINTLRIGGVITILGGRQSLCLAGSTLTTLESKLLKYDRTPHSVIGSSCLGASIVGGICNNSGGALVSRGPAFTRFALFARIDDQGRLALVNNLGIAIAGDPLTLLQTLDNGVIPEAAISNPDDPACLSDYEAHVRAVEVGSPARYNADARCHFEAAGSAGKVIVLAVRVDSFPAPKDTATFCLLSDDPDDFTRFRRDVLKNFSRLPVTAEYLHRDAARIGASHGNDICMAVRFLGARRMPLLFSLKRALDRMLWRMNAGGRSSGEKLLQAIGNRGPHPVPQSIRKLVDSKQHMLVVTTADAGINEARDYLAATKNNSLVVHECSEKQAGALQRLRFAAAGAMIRFNAVEPGSGPLVSLDCALPRNLTDWRTELPAPLAADVLISATYGHFLCHVFHLDFILRPGCDPIAFEEAAVAHLRGLGAECPAEHNFGHHYRAPENVVEFYRSLDPTNSLNPGIGLTSRLKSWQ